MSMSYKSLLRSILLVILSAGSAAVAEEEPAADAAGNDGGFTDQAIPAAGHQHQRYR